VWLIGITTLTEAPASKRLILDTHLYTHTHTYVCMYMKRQSSHVEEVSVADFKARYGCMLLIFNTHTHTHVFKILRAIHTYTHMYMYTYTHTSCTYTAYAYMCMYAYTLMRIWSKSACLTLQSSRYLCVMFSLTSMGFEPEA
jgi:hypothetical protein